jgi:hypothetical protein
MGRELTDTNAKLVAAVQSAADAQRERGAIQEKLDTALLEAAEARHAVATLVLREVSVVSGAAGRSTGRSGGSYPGGSAQEEADGQRLRAALVRQEAEREMAAALEREGKLKERVQAVLGETVLLKGERDLARAEAAEAKRRAAELEQLAAEERMHAAKAQYSLSTREAELQAAREQAENSAAARVGEAVATVRKELYERILGAEEAEKLTSRRPKPAGHPVIVTKDGIGLGCINFWMLGCFCEVVRIVDTNGDSHAGGGVFDAGEDAGFRRFIPKNSLPEGE